MFDHTCTSCGKRQLMFPSQITGLANTDRGIVLAFTCWCGAEQTLLTGRNAAAAAPAVVPAPAAAEPVRAA